MDICTSLALICIAGTSRKLKQDESSLVLGVVKIERVQKTRQRGEKELRRERAGNKAHVSWLQTYHQHHYTRKLLLNMCVRKNHVRLYLWKVNMFFSQVPMCAQP